MNHNTALTILRKYIKDNKLRSTPEREHILKEVLKFSGHFNAEQLYNLQKKKNDKIVLATIYNTLELFVTAGILTKYRHGAEHSYYEKVLDKQGHHHLICLDCGKILEFVADTLSRYELEIAKQKHFKVQNSTHQIFGICKQCQSKK